MASFLQILQKVGNVLLKTEPVVSNVLKLTPYAGIGVALDDVVGLIHGSVTTAEATTTTSGQGAQKAQIADTMVANGMDLVQTVLAMEGKQLNDDPALRAASIKSVADSYNAIAAWKNSWKIQSK